MSNLTGPSPASDAGPDHQAYEPQTFDEWMWEGRDAATFAQFGNARPSIRLKELDRALDSLQSARKLFAERHGL